MKKLSKSSKNSHSHKWLSSPLLGSRNIILNYLTLWWSPKSASKTLMVACGWDHNQSIKKRLTNTCSSCVSDVLILECESWEPQLKEILHLIACTISYVNVVGVRDYDDFNYLGTVYDRIEEKREFINIRYKMSQLVCLMPSSEI